MLIKSRDDTMHSMNQAATSQQNDATLLASVPEFVSFGGLLKATPSMEGTKRFIFIEASDESVDHQNEIILQKALTDSSDYYLRHGNVDISHYTILGPKSGIPNFLDYEIGKPIEVRVNGKSTFVKAELYQGGGARADNAQMVWDSMTVQSPPSRWYPSVGGSVLSKSVKFDQSTGERVAVIDKVRWNNLALDRTPVNKQVPEVSTTPIGVFAKSLDGFVIKALEAGYGTDSATLTGGAALRTQSQDHHLMSTTVPDSTDGYTKFRDKLAAAWKGGKGDGNGAQRLVSLAHNLGVTGDRALEWVERFLRDLETETAKRRSTT
jgi:hypothetical protein